MRTLKQLFRYGLVTVISYTFVIVGMYFFVEILKINSSISYFIIITANYNLAFLAMNYFVFSVNIKKEIIGKYIAMLIAFWVFNNLFFNFMTLFLRVKYIWAIVVNILAFGFIRFYIQRKYIFK